MPDTLYRKLGRRLASAPAELACRAMNLPFVATGLDRRHRLLHPTDAAAVALTGPERAVAEGLRRDGVFVTSLDALALGGAGGEAILAEADAAAAILSRRVAAMGKERPVMITTQPGDLLRQPALYRWGLNDTVRRIVGAYLGAPPAYDGPLLFHTPSDGRQAGTRMWHLDREDRQVVKVALYLHDVDADSGPFQLIGRSFSPKDGRFRYPVLDDAALTALTGEAVGRVTCTGVRGTLVFAETAQFYHRGKPSTGRARSAIFYSYFNNPPRHPFFCQRPGLSRAQIVQLTAGMSPAQLHAAQWRDAVPWPVRLIPPSLV